jgi:hypothetical protein
VKPLHFIAAAIISLASACTSVQTDSCGDYQVSRYRFRDVLFVGASFVRTEFPLSLENGWEHTFVFPVAPPAGHISAVVPWSGPPCVGPAPNLLLIHVPNIHEFIPPAQQVRLSNWFEKITAPVPASPFDRAVIKLTARHDGNVVAQNEIMLFKPNWHVIFVEGNADGILARPLFPTDISFDQLNVQMLSGTNLSNFRASAIFNSELDAELSWIRRLDDGEHPILRHLTYRQFQGFDSRSRRWPPRWLKLDPPERGRAKQGHTAPLSASREASSDGFSRVPLS